MHIGRLKHRITIQDIDSGKNSFGETENKYIDLKTVWAEIRPITGKSFFSAQQINSEITHQVVIRYTSGIKSSMRVLYKDRIFEILYVMNFNESNQAIQMLCKELI